MDSDNLVAAGLYDPDAPDARDRLALLDYIQSGGATIKEMVEADNNGNLTSLVLDLRLSRGELSAVDLAHRSSLPLDEVLETYRLLGVFVPDALEKMFGEREVRLLEMLSLGTVSLPEGMTDEILRSIGSDPVSVRASRIAERRPRWPHLRPYPA